MSDAPAPWYHARVKYPDNDEWFWLEPSSKSKRVVVRRLAEVMATEGVGQKPHLYVPSHGQLLSGEGGAHVVLIEMIAQETRPDR